MACFLAPTAVAIAVSIIRRLFKGFAERTRLDILELMLWGGALVLAFEHLWHGEVVPWPPFLTAMKSPEEWAIAINEIAVVGTSMNAAVLATWGGMLVINNVLRNIRLRKLGTALELESTSKVVK